MVQKNPLFMNNNEILRLLVELLGCDHAMVFQKSSLSLVLINLKTKEFCEMVNFWNVMPGSQPNISAIKRTRCSFTFVWKRRKNTFKIWLSPFFAQINLNWFSWGKKPWSFGQKQYTIHKNNEILRLLVELLGCDPAMVFQKSSLSRVLMN